MAEPKVYRYHKARWYAETFLVFFSLGRLTRGYPVGALMWFALMLIVIRLTRWRCYPFFAKLTIAEDYVEKSAFEYSFVKLPRERLHVTRRLLGKTEFLVFSHLPTEHLLWDDLHKLVRKEKAIMYPVTDEMRSDFPEFFTGRVLKA